nr:bifunctional nuclease family protein [Olsenella profusa]
MRRMDIQSVVVGGGPVASLIVLVTHDVPAGATPQQLPIRIGSVEATAITMGVRDRSGGRPMTHDLLSAVIAELGGRCLSVRVMSVQGTTFFAQVELLDAAGERHYVDARPSDAIALAVREGVAIYADESVLAAAALPDFRGVEADERAHELEEFHAFVEQLSPEDFNVAHGEQDGE